MSRMLDNLARVQEDAGAVTRPTPKLALVKTDLAFRARKLRGPHPMLFVVAFLVVGGTAFLIEGGFLSNLFGAGAVVPAIQTTSPAGTLGLNALRAGQFAEAEQQLHTATQKNPASAVHWINLGYAQKRMGLKKEAEKSYQHALAIEPRNIYALNNLAALYLKSDRSGEAETLLKQALDISANYGDARLNLAAVYEQEAKWPEAFAAYQAYMDQAVTEPAILTTVTERARKVRSLATAATSEEKF